MINEQRKREELDKILKSNEFKNSKSYKNLLKYLVECSINNQSPTESFIAIEGLGKDQDFDQSTDASVRVYIHNLRKKLASYYLNEGKFDSIKLELPKGQHYQVVFTPTQLKPNRTKFLGINVSALVIIILLNYYFISNSTSHIESQKIESLVWNNFGENDFSTLLVFGDFFIYKDVSDDLPKYVRDFRINSLEDLQKYNSEYNTSETHIETELSFLGKSSIDSFPAIFELIKSWNKDVKIILSSELKWEDLVHNNIVFIGSFKSLRLLKDLFTNLNSSYRIHPNTIFYKDSESDSLFEYRAPKDTKTGYLKDYALVTKIPGPDNNSIIIFTGTHDIGQSATVKSFTSKDFLHEFDKKYFNESQENVFFEGIFEVQGFERTGFHPNLIHFHKLQPDFQIPNME